jgi:AbrB family looped-hinge helix DNA binding protein
MNIEITKMTSKGQVVIPQKIRNMKGIEDGERFLVYDTEDSIVLKRVKNLEKTKDVEEFEKTFAKTWKIAKKNNLTREDVNEEIKAYRKEKDAENNS